MWGERCNIGWTRRQREGQRRNQKSAAVEKLGFRHRIMGSQMPTSIQQIDAGGRIRFLLMCDPFNWEFVFRRLETHLQ